MCLVQTKRGASQTQVDEHAARELELYADNTYALYGQKLSIVANIKKRLKNGTYDQSKAARLWQYWVDEAARLYAKEIGRSPVFTAATRRHVAEEYARSEIQRIKDGEYDDSGGPFGLGILG